MTNTINPFIGFSPDYLEAFKALSKEEVLEYLGESMEQNQTLTATITSLIEDLKGQKPENLVDKGVILSILESVKANGTKIDEFVAQVKKHELTQDETAAKDTLLNQLKDEKSHALGQTEEHEKKIQELSSQMGVLREKHHDVKLRAKRVKQEKADLLLKCESQKGELLDSENRIRAIAKEKELLSELIGAKTREIVRLASECDEFRKEKERAHDGEVASGKEAAVLRERVSMLEREIAARDLEVKGRDETIQNLRSRISQQSDDFASRVDDAMSMRAEIEANEARMRTKDQEIAKLVSQLQHARDKNRGLMERLVLGDDDSLRESGSVQGSTSSSASGSVCS